MAPRLLPPFDIRSRCEQYVERTEGLHLSSLIQSILVDIDPGKYGKADDEGKYMNFLMGLMFERALELAWLDREIEGNFRSELIRPGELIWTDPVTGKKVYITPDAYDTLRGRPEEYKCTKLSLNHDIGDRKFWHYWVQLKAQAYVMGSNSGVLRMLHINGNYSRDFSDPEAGYVIRSWEDEWTDTQLQENWDMLIGVARRKGWL